MIATVSPFEYIPINYAISKVYIKVLVPNENWAWKTERDLSYGLQVSRYATFNFNL